MFLRWVRIGLCLAWAILAQEVCGQNSQIDPQDPGWVLHRTGSITPQSHLMDLTIQGQWVFASPQGEQSCDVADVVRWGTWKGVQNRSAVWLVDGSWIVGNIQLEQGQVVVRSEYFEPLRISSRKVRGIVLAAPASLRSWVQLQSELQATTGNRDVVWLTGNRRVSGVLRTAVEEDGVTLRWEVDLGGQKTAIDPKDVIAIAYSPTLIGDLPRWDQELRLGLDDGTLIYAHSLDSSQSRVQVALPSGITLKSLDSRPEFAKAIRLVERANSAAKLLSAMEPASYRNPSTNLLTYELGRDLDVYRGPLVAGDGVVSRGLAMHSPSQVAYRWDGKKADLLAEVRFAAVQEGADDRLGSVQCQVLLAIDGKLVPSHTFSLDRSKPQTMETVKVDVSGAKLIVLVTDQSDFGSYGDHILWLNARLAE